jgi:hypothetical protein
MLNVFRWKSRKEAARKAAKEGWNKAHARHHARRANHDKRGEGETWPALHEAANNRLRIGA